MKKIILTLLLTLSALVNVNAVAAFSLDIDGNGTINASNDGLIIFKYLLNSNANNLHTTISSNAADDRKTTAQLKAYLDNSGDILDIDGNGTTNASNDGLIVFKYLLNSNANNLHTTIASNAPGSKTTTINLKAYLDQYISTDVSNLYSGDRPTELTAEQIAAADGAGNYGEHVAVLETANFSDYTISVDLGSRKIYVYDDASFINVVAEIYLGDNYTSLNNLGEPEFRGFFLETIQAIWDLVNPTEVRANRIAQLDALPSQYSLTDTVLIENTELGVSHVNWAYTQNGNQRSFSLSTSVALIEDITDWSTKYNELVAKLIADYATYQTDLAAIFANDTAPTELTSLLTAEANRVAGTETTVDNKELFTNLSGDGVDVTYGGDGSGNEIFAVSSFIDGNSISNNIIVNQLITSSPNEADFRAAFFAVILEKWNQLHPVLTAAEELVAIFALATSPTAFVDYPALDAEADGILQAARAQHIVDSLTNLNGVTVTYTINTTPKSFDVAKAGETTINVLQDSSSGGAVSLDTLSVFKDIYFQTIQAKWDILHTAGPTFESEVADIYANENAPTELGDFLQTYFEAEEVDGIYPDLIRLSSEDFTVTNFSFRGTNSIGYVELSNGDEVDEPSGTNYIDLEGEQLAGWALAIVQAIWDLVNPPTPVESEVADIYAADTPPTAYASGSVIDTDAQAVAQEGTVRDTFINRLSSSLYLTSNGYDTATGTGAEIEIRDNNNASLDPAVFVTTDAGAFAGMSGQAFSDFTFKIVLAIWHLEHPNYVAPTSHADRAAVLTAYNSIEGISNLTVKLANSNNLSIATVYLTWDLNGVAQALYYFSATNPTSTTDGEVRGDLSYYTPEQFETYRERLYNKLTDHILTPEEIAAALRAERIADLEGLDKDGVTVTQATAQADGFVVSTAGKSDVYFYANDYGSLTFEGLTTDQYIIYEAAIEAKRDEYILAAELAVLRTQRINELEALDKNGVAVVHHTRNNGEDTFSITKNPDQTFIHADVYGPGKVEDQNATEYGNYKAAIISKRNEYDPSALVNFQSELDTFYARQFIDDIDGGAGYGNQLSTALATAANLVHASNDNDIIEEFLTNLASGVTYKGGASHITWYQDSNILVTSNVGTGNGFYDIPITDNAYLGPNGLWQLNQLSASNIRHMTYHTMWNIWILSHQSDAVLRTARETWLEAYTHAQGADFYKGKFNGSDEYRAANGLAAQGTAITTVLYGNALVELLTLQEWINFVGVYKFSVDTVLGN